ncbi:MAG: hypothetical protein M3Y28_02280 [Armatimonadota bacterium]|nr:hypothetical protein [Armatimonadota bacterium]
MPTVSAPVHSCACPQCQGGVESFLTRLHQHINVLLSRFNEPQRRWYVGSLSLAPQAPTDIELSLITGLDEKTIRRGRRELEADLSTVPADRQRRKGGGRPAAEKKTLLSQPTYSKRSNRTQRATP